VNKPATDKSQQIFLRVEFCKWWVERGPVTPPQLFECAWEQFREGRIVILRERENKNANV
jgi:hypothetical protein